MGFGSGVIERLATQERARHKAARGRGLAGPVRVEPVLTRMFLTKQRASFLATPVCLGPRQTFIALCVSYLSAKREAFLTRHFLQERL